MGVIRTFEFVSSLRRMSVVVKRLKSTSMEIYVKGAPEVMSDICDPDSCMFNNFSCLFHDLTVLFQFPKIMKIYYLIIRNVDIE